MSNIIEVRSWEDMCTGDLHIKEVWSDGFDPEYIYSKNTILDRPQILSNLKAEYERKGLKKSPTF